MRGFVDIHSHILWGLDDGATDFQTSVEMLLIAAECGTSDIVATPHSDLRYSFSPSDIAQRIDDLSHIPGPKPLIHSGCDFHLHFDNITACLEDPGRFTINHLRYLMVEFSDSNIPKSSSEVFDRMLRAGITPVITHPERNPLLMKDLSQLVEWIHMGCLLQLTAQSLTGRFGKIAQNAAGKLLSRGMIHFIASDAHDPVNRPPDLRPAHAIVCKDYGEDMAHLLFRSNPAAVLSGELFEIDLPDSSPPGRKWFQFW